MSKGAFYGSGHTYSLVHQERLAVEGRGTIGREPALGVAKQDLLHPVLASAMKGPTTRYPLTTEPSNTTDIPIVALHLRGMLRGLASSGGALPHDPASRRGFGLRQAQRIIELSL